MAQFQYKAISESGELLQGQLVAGSVDEAIVTELFAALAEDMRVAA